MGLGLMHRLGWEELRTTVWAAPRFDLGLHEPRTLPTSNCEVSEQRKITQVDKEASSSELQRLCFRARAVALRWRLFLRWHKYMCTSTKLKKYNSTTRDNTNNADIAAASTTATAATTTPTTCTTTTTLAASTMLQPRRHRRQRHPRTNSQNPPTTHGQAAVIAASECARDRRPDLTSWTASGSQGWLTVCLLCFDAKGWKAEKVLVTSGSVAVLDRWTS